MLWQGGHFYAPAAAGAVQSMAAVVAPPPGLLLLAAKFSWRVAGTGRILWAKFPLAAPFSPSFKVRFAMTGRKSRR